MSPSPPYPGAAAQCPLHPDALGVATCARCGNFMCVTCTVGGSQVNCPSCRERLAQDSAFPFRREAWSIDGLLSFSWAALKRDWVMLSAGMLLVFAVSMAVGIVSNMLQLGMGGSEPNAAVTVSIIIGMSILQWIAQGLLQLGLIRMCFDSIAGRPVELGQLFSQVHKIGRLLLQLGVIFGIALVPMGAVFVPAFLVMRDEPTVIAVIMLVAFVPLIWLFIPLVFAQIELTYVEDVGPIQSIRNCFALAKRQRLPIVGVSLLGGVIVFVSLLACCIGVLPGTALFQLLLCTLYLTLRNGSAQKDLSRAEL
jgi:hypothetical protein